MVFLCYIILQRVKNVTHIYQHIYPSNKLINNQVEDTIDHTTEKKEYNANDKKQHKIVRLIHI